MMPLFEPTNAYRAHPGDEWDETDTCDAEMLAVFLLDDENDAAGMTFDFNLYNPKNDATMVSSESSEDEGQSEEGDVHMDPFLATAKRVASQVFIAPAPNMANLAASANRTETLVSPHHGQPVMHRNPAKRRCIGAPSKLPTLAPATQTGTAAEVGAPAGRKKSQAQVERRRERNRIIARRTRLGKKCFFESIKQEVLDLHRENQMLKDLMKLNMAGEDSAKLLEECNAESMLPEGALEACYDHSSGIDHQDFNGIPSTLSTTDQILHEKSIPVVVVSDC